MNNIRRNRKQKPIGIYLIGFFSVVIGLGLLFLMFFSPSDGSNTSERLALRGMGLAQNGDLEGAKELLLQAIELDENNAGAWAGLAFTNLQQGNYYEAIDHYTRAIELNPSQPQWNMDRSIAYIRLGMYEEALPDVNHVISTDPLNTRYLRHRWSLYSDLGDWEAALKDANTLLELEPDYPSNTLYLAISLDELGHIEEAIENYEKFLRSASEEQTEIEYARHRIEVLEQSTDVEQ